MDPSPSDPYSVLHKPATGVQPKATTYIADPYALLKHDKKPVEPVVQRDQLAPLREAAGGSPTPHGHATRVQPQASHVAGAGAASSPPSHAHSTPHVGPRVTSAPSSHGAPSNHHTPNAVRVLPGRSPHEGDALIPPSRDEPAHSAPSLSGRPAGLTPTTTLGAEHPPLADPHPQHPSPHSHAPPTPSTQRPLPPSPRAHGESPSLVLRPVGATAGRPQAAGRTSGAATQESAAPLSHSTEQIASSESLSSSGTRVFTSYGPSPQQVATPAGVGEDSSVCHAQCSLHR
jgi:hypothetical protein